MEHLPAKTALWGLLLLLLPPFQAGCAVPFPAYEPINDASLLADLQSRLPASPPSGRMLLRCLLQVRGMELPLTLRLLLGQPERMRALALNDLGGTMFHVLHLDGETKVLLQPTFMPKGFLTEGMVQELAHLFLSAKKGTAEAVSLEDGRPALLLTLSGRQALLWHGEEGRGEGFLDQVHLGSQGRSISRIKILEWAREGEGEGRTVVLHPSRITVENDLFDYSLDIRVVQWEAASLDPRVFQLDPRSLGQAPEKR